MLTIFAFPKPFKGHVGVIQRNAIAQWSRLRPKPDILLFGNEEGTAEIAQEFALRHVPAIKRNEFGTPLLNDVFAKAHDLASYDILCYVNADIILLGYFMKAVQQVSSWGKLFLMIGVRREVDLDIPAIYESPMQEVRLRALVEQQDRPISLHGIDYFAFPRGLFSDIPPFAIGRMWWDNWLLWKARKSNAAVVDASEVVFAVHQNHDYSHINTASKNVMQCEEAKRNKFLAARGFRTIEDATHRLTRKGIAYNVSNLSVPLRRALRACWWSLLGLTQPLRHPLGLRQERIASVIAKIKLSSTHGTNTIR